MEMSESDHVRMHMSYWRGVRDTAAETLARICDCTIPETKAEIAELLAHVMCCGNAGLAAQAYVAASEWTHADNELTYKKRQVEQED